MDKACFKCGETKPLTEFYRHPQMADGHVNKCKQCNKKDVRTNYQNNRGHYREYDKQRGMRPDRVAMRRRYQQTERGKAALRKATKTNRAKFPEKYAARTALGNAMRDGKISRPDHCEACSTKCVPHGHHDDYSKPLDVEWLCVPCHKLEHAA